MKTYKEKLTIRNLSNRRLKKLLENFEQCAQRWAVEWVRDFGSMDKVQKSTLAYDNAKHKLILFLSKKGL
jgi:hypothetical protein